MLVFFFMLFSIVFSVNVVFNPNPFFASLSLILTLVCLSGIFICFDVLFFSFLFLIIYVGAVAVLILIVVMCFNVNLFLKEALTKRFTLFFVSFLVSSLFFFLIFFFLFYNTYSLFLFSYVFDYSNMLELQYDFWPDLFCYTPSYIDPISFYLYNNNPFLFLFIGLLFFNSIIVVLSVNSDFYVFDDWRLKSLQLNYITKLRFQNSAYQVKLVR